MKKRVMIQMPVTDGIKSVFDARSDIEYERFTEVSEANILQHIGNYDAVILGVAAFTPRVEFDVMPVGGVRSTFFGGEGLFLARLRGPGIVWIQSLPFARLAALMLAASGSGGQNRGEGSVLGRFGDMLDGD